MGIAEEPVRHPLRDVLPHRIPAKAGIQRLYAPQEGSKALDSGFRRNDGEEIGHVADILRGL